MSGQRSAKPAYGLISAADLHHEVSQLGGDEGGLRLVAAGEEHAATQEAHGGDQFRQIRACLRDRHLHALCVHASDSNPSIACTTRRLVQFKAIETCLSGGVYVDHDFDRHERYRTSVERYIYVIEFASRTVKVGQTKDAPKRLADHVKSATIHRDRVVRSWFSEPHLGYQENERALIDYCARKWTLVTGHEFFLEADFDDVVAYAQGLPFRRLSSAQIIEALAEADRRAEDRSAYFAEIRSLAELKKATDSAAHRIGLIASLANQDNRWQASDATFETLKDLYAVVPAPWAQNDPTATQRYLIACGAPAETAMLAAPEFELGMRTLYAMTRFKEPESFEDLARFCSPFMAGEAR